MTAYLLQRSGKFSPAEAVAIIRPVTLATQSGASSALLVGTGLAVTLLALTRRTILGD
jgi:hypothetical protein